MNPSQLLASTAASAADASLALLDEPEELGAFTEWQRDAGGATEAVSRLQLSGMTCGACAGIIESALLHVDGVREARVSMSGARAEVRWDPARTRAAALVAAIEAAGYGAAPDAAAPERALREREARRSLWRLFVAAFCMMQVMMYATPAYVAAPGDIDPELLRLLQWASWLLSLPVLLFSSQGFFAGALRQVRARRIGMDVPVSIGIVVTFVVSSGATFQPGGIFGTEVYFDSMTMFVCFLLGGRWLELRARHRVAASLENAVARLPESVLRVAADGSVSAVTPRQLRLGDRVRVAAGQAFPADGVLLTGRTEADEALLTGESQAVPKQPGDELVAGALNLGAPVEMRVDRIGRDTRFEAIVALMRGALAQRPPLVQLVDRIAGPFLWAVLLLAGGAAVAWSFIEPSRAVWVAVSVLIVTCPCALSLGTPSALLAATGALARRGVLLQRLEALEALARIDWLFVDKTGTLTDEQPQLARIVRQPAAPALDDAALLAAAASLAASSTHPLSRVLAAAAPQAPAVWHELEEVPGQGLQARGADGRRWRLGAAAWVGVQEVGDGMASEVWFGPAGEPWASFEFVDRLRPDSAAAVQRLRKAGVHVALLSGDRAARVREVAAEAGIADARGGVTPEEKLAAMSAAQVAGHRVAMVGDGINDAPVLARADVSFAFGHGAAIAKARADAIVLGSRLGDVADARELAIRTMRIVRQNLAWAAAYNAACIPMALVGWLPPWAAGLGMALSSLLVVLNAMRLARPPVRD